MFSKRTMLVVGAGASKEVELPIGSELAENISELLTFRFDMWQLSKGDHRFLDATRRHLANDDEKLESYLLAAAQIAEGVRTVNSIDNYIDIHRHDPRVAACGKAAITYSILQAEKSSSLWSNPNTEYRLNLSVLENTWLVEFGRILVYGVPISELNNIFSNVTIICFNYDRVIEEFLAQWLRTVYKIDMQSAKKLC